MEETGYYEVVVIVCESWSGSESGGWYIDTHNITMDVFNIDVPFDEEEDFAKEYAIDLSLGMVGEKSTIVHIATLSCNWCETEDLLLLYV